MTVFRCLNTALTLRVLWSLLAVGVLVLAVTVSFYAGAAGATWRVPDAEMHRLPSESENIVNAFHNLYGYSGDKTWRNTFWRGTPVMNNPMDLWIYQEIIYETRPDWLLETGTYKGGSALFFASLFDLINNGQVVTVDITDFAGKPEHRRIKYLLGSSTSDQLVNKIKRLIKDSDKVMVMLDSDHRAEHVLNELRIYSKLVTQGCYLVIEDTALNGHPVYPNFGPGPMEAVQAFLKENNDFVVDESREKFLFTASPRGYLRKVK